MLFARVNADDDDTDEVDDEDEDEDDVNPGVGTCWRSTLSSKWLTVDSSFTRILANTRCMSSCGDEHCCCIAAASVPARCSRYFVSVR